MIDLSRNGGGGGGGRRAEAEGGREGERPNGGDGGKEAGSKAEGREDPGGGWASNLFDGAEARALMRLFWLAVVFDQIKWQESLNAPLGGRSGKQNTDARTRKSTNRAKGRRRKGIV